MKTFPMTNIGGIDVSRVTVGTNPFVGSAHFSKARADWLVRYFTVERVVEVASKRPCSKRVVTIGVASTTSPTAAGIETKAPRVRPRSRIWPSPPMSPRLARRASAGKIAVVTAITRAPDMAAATRELVEAIGKGPSSP